jgi:hypothetical protein
LSLELCSTKLSLAPQAPHNVTYLPAWVSTVGSRGALPETDEGWAANDRQTRRTTDTLTSKEEEANDTEDLRGRTVVADRKERAGP